MDKVKNIQQATDVVYAKLKALNPDIEKEDVYDTIMDEVIESVEFILTDEDTRFLEDNEEDNTAIDEYLQRKVPDYHNLINEIVADMVSEEINLEGIGHDIWDKLNPLLKQASEAMTQYGMKPEQFYG